MQHKILLYRCLLYSKFDNQSMSKIKLLLKVTSHGRTCIRQSGIYQETF
jgi:hypothetical protein